MPVIGQLIQYLTSNEVEYAVSPTRDQLTAQVTGLYGPLTLRMTPRQDQHALLLHVIDVGIVPKREDIGPLESSWSFPCVSLVVDAADGKIDALTSLPLGDEGLAIPALNASLSVLFKAADILKLIVELLRQGESSFNAVLKAEVMSVTTPFSVAPQPEGGRQFVTRALRKRGHRLWGKLQKARDNIAYLKDHLTEFDDPILNLYIDWSLAAHQDRQADIAGAISSLVHAALLLRFERQLVRPSKGDQTHRLLSAQTREDVESVAAAWPEVLLLTDFEFIRRQGGGRPAGPLLRLLREVRRERPVRAAVLDLLEAFVSPEEAREAARKNALLHGEDALRELLGLSLLADQRGEYALASRYRQLEFLLRRWQETLFSERDHPRETGLPPGVNPSHLVESMLLIQQIPTDPPGWGNFIARNVDRFTKPIMSYLGFTLAQNPLHIAPDTYRLLYKVHYEKLNREMESLPPQQRVMFSEVGGLREGQNVSNVQARRELCQSLLSHVEREKRPYLWAWLHEQLGDLSRDLYIRTGDDSHFKVARVALETALSCYEADEFRPLRARVEHALGGLFMRCYEMTHNDGCWYTAEQHYERALGIRMKEVTPVEWADTKAEMGILADLRYRWAALEDDGLRAEKYYREASETYKEVHNWNGMAQTDHEIGGLLILRYKRTSRDSDASEAAAHLQRALEQCGREGITIGEERVRNSLAQLFLQRYENEDQDHFAAEAEGHLRHILSTFDRHTSPIRWANYQYSLGVLHSLRYKRGGREEDRAAAERCLKSALEEMTPTTTPAQAATFAGALAHLYESDGDWAGACNAYEVLITTVENQYLASQSDVGRRTLMRVFARQYHRAALCRTHLHEPAQGLAQLEKGRARILSEVVGLEASARSQHGEQGKIQLGQARLKLQLAEANLSAAGEMVERAYFEAQRREALEAREKAIKDLANSYASLRQLVQTLSLSPPSLTADELLALTLPEGVAAISLAVANEEAVALVLHGGQVTTVPLPSFTLDQLIDLMTYKSPQVSKWLEDYEDEGGLTGEVDGVLQGADEESALEASSLREHKALVEIAGSKGNYQLGWLYSYRLAFDNIPQWRDAEATKAALAGWMKTLTDMINEVALRLWQPLTAMLPESVSKVLFVPSGLTSLLPIHAAAPEHLVVAYAPSISVWQQCHKRGSLRRPDSIFVAAPSESLPFTGLGAEWLKERSERLGTPIVILRGDEATKDAIIARAADCSVMNFFGHAAYNPHNPLQSYLRCADGDLTLDALRREMKLDGARLVLLSACETGITDITSGDEFIGLPAALLESGAPAVIASLWRVSDLSSAILIDRFYELWLGNEDEITIASAIHSASQWLRNATNVELLPRIARSNLTDKAKTRAYTLLMNRRPFREPFDWVPFASYGAVI